MWTRTRTSPLVCIYTDVGIQDSVDGRDAELIVWLLKPKYVVSYT